MLTIDKSCPSLGELLRGIPPSLYETCRRISVPQGGTLVQEGTLLPDLYLVLSGRLFAERLYEGGRVYDYAELRSGMMVGAMEAVLGQERVCSTIRAAVPCELWCIPRDGFVRWLGDDHALALYVLRFVTVYCRDITEKHLQSSGSEAVTRLAAHLLELRGSQAQAGFPVRQSRQDMADQLGVNVRTVNRAVRELEEAGCLTVRHGKIFIAPEESARLRESLRPRSR